MSKSLRVPVNVSLILFFVTAVFFLVYPVYVIRPFRYQGPQELSTALAILRVRPFVEIGCLVFAAVCAFLGWRLWTTRRSRILAVAAVVVIAASAGLSRINIYEKMFHPIEAPQFESLSASKLAPGEMVLAIEAGGISRAYPIRVVSYHHIVNDTLGGVPIAATY